MDISLYNGTHRHLHCGHIKYIIQFHTYIFDCRLVYYCLHIGILLVKFVSVVTRQQIIFKIQLFLKQSIHCTHRRGGDICAPVMQSNLLIIQDFALLYISLIIFKTLPFILYYSSFCQRSDLSIESKTLR